MGKYCKHIKFKLKKNSYKRVSVKLEQCRKDEEELYFDLSWLWYSLFSVMKDGIEHM